MSMRLFQGDCLEVMRGLPNNSVDSVVTDPPYELSQNGEASANLVALELMFPEYANTKSSFTGEDKLPLLVSKIVALDRMSGVPTPAATMPKCTVAFDDQVTQRKIEIKNAEESPVALSRGVGSDNKAVESSEYLGCFSFKLTDRATMLQALNSSGCCFYSGGIRIGARIRTTALPSLLHSLCSIDDGGYSVGLVDDTFTSAVGAFGGAEHFTVPRLDAARCTIENLPTSSALVLLSVLKSGGAQLITANSAASSLPSKLEARRIRVVGLTTNRTITFDLILCPQELTSRGFMGKEWDGSKVAHNVALWEQCLRVLKPGGHLLAFGGSRTYHRLACAIEDAGFEIRDQIMWVYGSGFPKSLDVSKAVDKAAGAERPVLGKNENGSGPHKIKLDNHGKGDTGIGYMDGNGKVFDVTGPATDAARIWSGWGTALKPAHEPIVVARKPLEGTVAANVLKWGTGAVNIDGCRVGPGDRISGGGNNFDAWREGEGRVDRPNQHGNSTNGHNLGRWPANLIHDGSEEVLACFPNAPGQLADASSNSDARKTQNCYGVMKRGSHEPSHDSDNNGMVGFKMKPGARRLDNGSAARFFYCAKASKSDRGIGNTHPTVKPLALMRYLCRLVTPPGGVVLDPFLGSGTTGVACAELGYDFIGIEREAGYFAFAKRRIEAKKNGYQEALAELLA